MDKDESYGYTGVAWAFFYIYIIPPNHLSWSVS